MSSITDPRVMYRAAIQELRKRAGDLAVQLEILETRIDNGEAGLVHEELKHANLNVASMGLDPNNLEGDDRMTLLIQRGRVATGYDFPNPSGHPPGGIDYE